MSHDEHDNVSTERPQGVHAFLRQQNIEPFWEAPVDVTKDIFLPCRKMHDAISSWFSAINTKLPRAKPGICFRYVSMFRVEGRGTVCSPYVSILTIDVSGQQCLLLEDVLFEEDQHFKPTTRQCVHGTTLQVEYTDSTVGWRDGELDDAGVEVLTVRGLQQLWPILIGDAGIAFANTSKDLPRLKPPKLKAHAIPD